MSANGLTWPPQGNTVEERGFSHESMHETHEGVVHDVFWRGQPVDEEGRRLGLEARSIGRFRCLRLLAARCRLVQNSLTNTSRRRSRPSLDPAVADVDRPFQLKAVRPDTSSASFRGRRWVDSSSNMLIWRLTIVSLNQHPTVRAYGQQSWLTEASSRMLTGLVGSRKSIRRCSMAAKLGESV